MRHLIFCIEDQFARQVIHSKKVEENFETEIS